MKKSKLNKLIFGLSFLTLFVTSMPMQPVQAAEQTSLIRSEGFLTEGLKDDSCVASGEMGDQVDKYADMVADTYKDPNGDGVGLDDVVRMGIVTTLLSGFFDDALGAALKMFVLVNNDCSHFTQVGGLGLVQQLFVLTEPVNVTNVSPLINVTGLVIWLALTTMIFALLGYAYKLLKGDEDTEPLKFAAKFVSVMILVYYAPYFVQDILNINNTIVSAISKYPIAVELGNGDKGENIALGIEYILPFTFISYFTAISLVTGLGGINFLGLLLIIIVLILVIVPLAKIVAWWYIRLFKLFMYTAISPLMFASLLFPRFSKTGKGFIKNLCTEAFSQTFVLIGLLVFSAYVAVIPNIITSISGGIIGYLIAFYVAVKFLEDLPAMASSLLDGGSLGSAGSGASDGLSGKYNPASAAFGGAVAGVNGYRKLRDRREAKERQAIIKADHERKTGGKTGGEKASTKTATAAKSLKSQSK